MIGGTSRVVCDRGGGDGSSGCRDGASFEDISEGGDGYIS
jgi:hypothetical protein